MVPDDTPPGGPEPTPLESDPTDSFDLEHAERVRVGVTRGETDLEFGPPRDYPDRADISVRPESNGGDERGSHRVVLSIDAMAGDHGTGHADAELTPAEARALRDQLGETVRWMTEDDRENPSERDRDSDGDHEGTGRQN